MPAIVPYPSPIGGLTRPQDALPPDNIEITICTTIDRFMAMLSSVYTGGYELGYGHVGDHNIDLLEALADVRTCGDETITTCADTPTPTQTHNETPPSTTGQTGSCGCDTEEEMGRLFVDEINGQKVLRELCCDGVITHGTLGGVAIGASGDIANPDDFSTSEPVNTLSTEPTPCDISSQVIPYILSELSTFADGWQTASAAGDSAANWFGSTIGSIPIIGGFIEGGIQFLTSLDDSGVGALETVVEDADFRLRAQQEYIGVASNHQGAITRSLLGQWASALPIVWGGYPIRSIMQSFVLILNMENVNTQARISAGTANTALCNELYDRNGLVYVVPLVPTINNGFHPIYGDPVVVESFSDATLDVVDPATLAHGEWSSFSGGSWFADFSSRGCHENYDVNFYVPLQDTTLPIVRVEIDQQISFESYAVAEGLSLTSPSEPVAVKNSMVTYVYEGSINVSQLRVFLRVNCSSVYVSEIRVYQNRG